MTETYDEHMAEMLRLGGAHECASDCPLPPDMHDGRECLMPSACGVSGYVCSNSRGPSGSLQTEADYYDDVEGVVAELVGVEAALEQVRRRLVKATDTLGGVARLSSIPDTGSARQKHAAWCWLPLDHQGQCEGDQ